MEEPRIIGRYALYDAIASGGMATVHLGRVIGAQGFTRPVAIKRLHPQFARDPYFVSMFVDEARLASRISHPNVVSTLDVVQDGDELLLVMDYVRGASLSRLLRGAAATKTKLPPRVVSSIVCDVLHGLHAAHEAKSDAGEPLNIVHRDISPQNVMVGTDGVARVLDFGIAKASSRAQHTKEGQLKGKVAYMPPEQIRSQGVTRRADLWAVGVVLWESLVADRLFRADDDVAVLHKVLEAEIPAPSARVPELPPALDAVVAKALARDPEQRWATAREMAAALEAAVAPASPPEIGDWVERLAAEELGDRASRVAEIERSASSWSAGAMKEPPAPNVDVTKPDTTKPDTTKPDTTKPDTTKPDTTKPDTTKPDTTKPEAATRVDRPASPPPADAAKPEAATRVDGAPAPAKHIVQKTVPLAAVAPKLEAAPVAAVAAAAPVAAAPGAAPVVAPATAPVVAPAAAAPIGIAPVASAPAGATGAPVAVAAQPMVAAIARGPGAPPKKRSPLVIVGIIAFGVLCVLVAVAFAWRAWLYSQQLVTPAPSSAPADSASATVDVAPSDTTAPAIPDPNATATTTTNTPSTTGAATTTKAPVKPPTTGRTTTTTAAPPPPPTAPPPATTTTAPTTATSSSHGKPPPGKGHGK